MTMTNAPIDNELTASESIITVDLINKATGATYAGAGVYGTNTLAQVLEEYAGDIGIDPSGKVIFINKRTNDCTSDSAATVAALGLQDGDVLSITDDAHVASEDDIIQIDLLNQISGTTFPKVSVYGYNTMFDVLDEYAGDIGIDPNSSKIIFTNKRTGEATCNSDTTVAAFGLCNGDVLAVADNGGVAAGN